jgi:putative FmdB family regulatory protein
MPIYGYRCGTCGHEFELLQNLSDQPPSTCPKCGAKTLKKKHYAAGVIFKGSGFYTTDYKGSASGEASSNGSKGSESGSETKTETKAESKSESKTESKPKSENKTQSKSVPKAEKDS